MSYYRTVVVLEVLSQNGPVDGDDVLNYYIPAIDGGQSATVLSSDSVSVSAPDMARYLTAQGSDPGFFGITETS